MPDAQCNPVQSVDFDTSLLYDGTGAWAAIAHFFQQPWSDGLPVVPPIEALVRQMLDTVARRTEEVVGLVAPRFGEATVGNLAVHAVLAGCLPQYC